MVGDIDVVVKMTGESDVWFDDGNLGRCGRG